LFSGDSQPYDEILEPDGFLEPDVMSS